MARTKQAEAAEKKTAAAKKAEEEKLAAEAVAEAENIADEQPEEEEEEAEMEQDEAVEAEDAAIGEGEGAATGEGEAAADVEDGKRVVKKVRQRLTQKDYEYIAEMLKRKIELSDGTEVSLLSFGPTSSPNPEMRQIVCHLCRVVNVLRPGALKTHLNGGRHRGNLIRHRKTNDPEKFRQPFRTLYRRDGHKVQQFVIYPGENIETITPQYESRLVDKDEWENFNIVGNETLLKQLSEDPVHEYNKTRAVIGLDYIIKMKDRDAVKSFCVLCDAFAPSTVYQHVTHPMHQATYIIKHFPSLYEKVVAGLKITDDFEKEIALRNIFRNLYRKIEIKHGFKMIKVVHAPEFFRLRRRYLNTIRKASYYDENTLKFTDAEVNDLIRKSNNNISFIQPDPPLITTGVEAPVTPAGRKRGAPAAVAGAPAIKNQRANESDVELWSKYRVIMPKRLATLAAQYKKYEQEPKNHPKYQEEWKQFWHARCAQLKKDNIDPDNYNFDKEWLPFWEKRLRKLYNKDVADRKSTLRQSFGLPIGRRTPSPSNQPRNMRQPPNNQTIRPLLISNNFVPNNNNIGGGDMGQGIDRRQRFVQPRMEQQPQQQQPWNRQAPQVRVTREPVSILSVLRLLTALEDQLGSLGPKSVQLLSKAVLCEKNNQNSLELLTDNDCYLLFATAREKLKGQIMANVVDNSKVPAVNTTVADLSTILVIMDKANQQDGRGSNNGNNSFGGGNNYGRNNTGFDGGNANNNFGGGNNGNFRNNNNDDGGNFGNNNNNGGSGNYSDNLGNSSRGGLNDGGNYRNSNNDSGDFPGGFNNNASGNYRNNSNSNDGNYRGSNDGGNYRNNSNNVGNFMGLVSNNDGGNFRGSVSKNNGGNRGSISNNNDGGNYLGGNNNNDVRGNRGVNNDSVVSRRGNVRGNYRKASNNNDGGNNRSTDGGNVTASNYRSDDDGKTFSTTSLDGGNNSSNGFDTNPSNNIQYRSLSGNNDNFNPKSRSFGILGSTSNFSRVAGVPGSNTSNQRGNWLSGGGNGYSTLNKPNASSPAFVGGIGGRNNNPLPLMSFDRKDLVKLQF